jgi:RimJ/RimL family protein N-acetyltransferase
MVKNWIETERLRIRPLNYNELEKLAEFPDELAEDLGLIPSDSLSDHETRDAILNTLLPNLADPKKNPYFWTMWIIIDKTSGAIAGGICFHGEPDETGEVEIGYGTDLHHRNTGIMTETLAGFIGWIRKQGNVNSVRAETDAGNQASIRVLEKSGFTEHERTGSSVIHRLVMAD